MMAGLPTRLANAAAAPVARGGGHRRSRPRAAALVLILPGIAAPTRAFVVGPAGGGFAAPKPTTPPPPPPALAMVREVDRFRPRRPTSPNGGRVPDVVPDDYDVTDDYGDAEGDWTPDREKARAARELGRRAEAVPPPTGGGSVRGEHGPVDLGSSELLDDADDFFRSESQPRSQQPPDAKKARSVYTTEEEEIIAAMGGKSLESPSPRREPGFMGDSTLREIASDYQVPVCYLADVLCGWGVPVPIDVDSRLGDLVTGEMAFALVEAVHTLDMGEINDRYSNFDLLGLCFEYGIDLKEAFDFCVAEGWNLPFGVRTFLRVEQEDELVRSLSDEVIY